MSAKKVSDKELRIEDNYIEGYDPVSLEAPHSSLLKSSTWWGMGIILSSIAFSGIILFGLASGSVDSQANASTYVIVGVVATLAVLLFGVGLVKYGRRDYKAYVKRTGRHN
ncbi:MULTISPECIES: hypothetical protein [unclassified Corynebacterium]|uniref:hypothetical protein n=1 Tax=unclassified Corynebacterium TaxID=2624378 RepID=UPI001C48B1C2|nr:MULTISPECIES: hypothetical protein [unclassified Corynebacterium]MBV7282526.1 hypothetical protein [Corynebacterium sp. TAE3-ERU30]MBV7302126.1 hypothetical protein [Corynebacterium sp. TAE3-ERU2]